MGIEGAFGFEFIRHFAHKRPTRWQDTVFRPARKPPDFFPINLQGTPQSDCRQLLRTLARGRMGLRINGHQHALNQQLLRLDDLNDTIGTLELAQRGAGQGLQRAKQINDLYVSPDVLDEAAQGDAEAARLRLEAIANLPVLAVTDDVEALTRRILATGLIPPRATRDAGHIAFASVHGMDFLLTWNCRHIHNAMISRRLSGVCAALGFTLPVLCTPRELMIK